MKRVPKGCFGYIESARKAAFLRTATAFVLCVGCFLAGRILTGSSRNVLSIVAAVLCLPFGVFAVNYVMFLWAKPCSRAAYEKIEAARGHLLVLYDLTLTGRDHDFNIASAVALDKETVFYTEEETTDESLFKTHIRVQMALSDYRELQITLCKDADAYCEKLQELEDLRSSLGIDMQAEEDAWQPGTVQTMTGVLTSISL